MNTPRLGLLLVLLTTPLIRVFPDPADSLTVDQAVLEAWDHGPDAATAKLTWEQDQESWVQARAVNGPVVTATATGGGEAQNETTADAIGTTGQTQTGQTYSGNLTLALPATKLGVSASHQLAQATNGTTLPTTNLGVTLSQEVFDGYPGGRAQGALLLAQYQWEGRQLVWQNTRNTVATSVRTAYVTLWGAQKAEQAKKAAWDAQAQNAVTTQAYWGAKTVTQLDVIQAQDAAEAARLDWLSGVQALSTAQGKLDILLGRPWNAPVVAQDVPAHQELLPDREQALGVALKGRTEMLQWELDRKTADTTQALKNAARWPAVNLTGGANYKRTWGTVPLNDSGLTGGLSLDFTLWDGGQAASQAAAAGLVREQTALQRIQVANTISQDTDAAIFGVRDAQARANLAEKSLDETSMALDAAQLKFQSGLSSRLDVLNALSAREAASSQRIQALTNVEIAWLNWNKAEGWPP